MNKYNYLLNILINKILFISERCNYNNNNSLSLKDLVFVSSIISRANTLLLFLILLVILKRSSSFTVKNNITLLSKSLIKFAIDSKISK